ncbi:MAG: DegT/DnrJ/EryC1/StrS family aminotransferase [Candidatus Magasanikbacteria bacterium]|nr:DegT/DnrJ/EryC1/StrS family aminotransferase [Candidatus Magasanikbacteria bacterium]
MPRSYPLARPVIGSAEFKAVQQVLHSGVLSLGRETPAFEAVFAKFVGTKYAAAVSSGTAGLHLAMIAAGIAPGDEVITTPFSFIASANCILYVGAKPVFVDIDPQTYNLDPAKIAAAVTKKTRAILVVHIFGQPADMQPIIKIARQYKLKIIEDACESLGARYRGRSVGTFGESAVFAFYPNKQMTTGEGGMVVTDSRRVYDLAVSLRNQGRDQSRAWLNHVRLGYNYRLDEMSAALGRAQLRRLPALLKARQQVAAWYHTALASLSDYLTPPVTAAGNTHTWFLYVVRLRRGGAARDRLIKRLAQRGIPAKPYFPSIHLFSFYRQQFGYRPGAFLRSEAASNSTLALPFYVGLTRRDIRYIVGQLRQSLKF